MTIKDMRNKTPVQLTKHIEQLRTEIIDFKREARSSGASTNVRKVSSLKREIAKVMTVMNEQDQDKSIAKENE